MRFMPWKNNSVAAVPVDMFWDSQGAAGVVDAVQLAAQNHTTEGVPGAWTSVVPGDFTGIEFNAAGALASLRNPVSVNGVVYSGVPAVGFRIDNTSLANLGCVYTLAATKAAIMVGFFVKADPETDYNYSDFCGLWLASGAEWAVVQRKNDATPTMRAHSYSSTVSAGNINNALTYWVQLKFTQNALSEVAYWSVVAGVYTLIGSASAPTTHSNNPVAKVIAPCLNAHSNTSPTKPYYYSCNFVFQWTAPGAVDALML